MSQDPRAEMHRIRDQHGVVKTDLNQQTAKGCQPGAGVMRRDVSLTTAPVVVYSTR